MNKNVIVAGWDPGRLTNKLYLKDKKIINMNAICAGYDRRILDEETGDPQNLLDVEIYREASFLGRYLVAGMAFRYHRDDLRWSANGIPKFDIEDSNDEIIKLVTHLALSQYKRGEEISVTFRLGTGAPTEEYFQHPQLLKAVDEALNHNYTAVFKHPMFGGASVNLRILKTHFKPEGTSSLFSMSFTDELKIRKEIPMYLDKGFMIGMNIGSSTTDFAIMNPQMRFESSGFFGIAIGSSNPLNDIREMLYKKYGYQVPKVKLDYLIRTHKRINYKGQIIDLEKISKHPFENLYSLLRTKFYDQIEMRGIELGEAGALFVSGGTSIHIGKQLQSFIPGVQTVLSSDPLFEDARGNYLEALFHECQDQKCQQEIFTDDEDVIEVS